MKMPLLLKRLWLGQMPLQEAFWRYLITYDLILNLVATTASVTAILAGAPIVLALVLHLFPVPYSLFAATGAWRSADRFDGNPSLANVAKIAIIIWIGFWLFF
jgi:hypothetical protein